MSDRQMNEAATGALQQLQALPAANDGFKILLKKEMLRFWRVALQTIAAPSLTAVLYLLIFGEVLQGRVQVYPGVSYIGFLVPGLVMMSVLQNAFANSASSMVQSKIMGNLVFQLLAPLSAIDWFVAYVGAAMARGLLVGLCVYVVTFLYVPPHVAHFLWTFVFALLGAGMMSVLGLLAGLWANKYDQMAMFQNFLVMPMTFLAGVFYSIHSLPRIWLTLSHLNPFFFMIDGFRYGFFCVSDVSPWLSLSVAGGSLMLLSALALYLLHTGYKLRN